MLSKFRVQHYKSLYDTEVDLEPLTVFIGPNGSGKSNICEALAVFSNFLQASANELNKNHQNTPEKVFLESLRRVNHKINFNIKSKFWQGKIDYIYFKAQSFDKKELYGKEIIIRILYLEKKTNIEFNKGFTTKNFQANNNLLITDLTGFLNKQIKYCDTSIGNSLKKVKIYDFAPSDLSEFIQNLSTPSMTRTGEGIAYSLVDILHSNRKSFDELEERLTKLVPNIARISLPRDASSFKLELIDKYSENHIPASDISDGTLRILAFLVALYQEDTPSIICFEEIENGVHPWLLHKMMELLKIVSTEGINGNPVQILITTHSPLILNYVEPHQVRAVELDEEGKTQVHSLPTDSVRFQKSLEAYDGELGELWFTNVFGGNPV